MSNPRPGRPHNLLIDVAWFVPALAAFSLAVFVRHPAVAIALLVMAALQVYVGGSVDSWTVAGGFGQRRFVALTTVLVIGIASIRDRPVKRVLIALCVYWNIALIAEFATGLMDRQRLDPRKNAYDALVTLPREAPALAYRYVFDRRSFYRATPTP